MKTCSVTKVFFIISMLLVFGWVTNLNVGAQSDSLILKVEQPYDTYGVGGTCIPGGNNLFIADVDGNVPMEIITGGFSYYIINGSRTTTQAPLNIWNWDGKNITLLKSHKWTGSISCVHVADVDADGINEIITSGSIRNETDSYSSLRVWRLRNGELSLKVHYETAPGSSVFVRGSVFVNDLNNDGKQEIITIGRLIEDTESTSQLCLWHLEQDRLILKEQGKLNLTSINRANSVFASDLNNDGEIEIIVAGYSNDLKNSSGHLSVWQWDGQTFSLMGAEEWRMVDGYALNSAGGVQGNTIVSDVKVAELDGDGVPEIVTGGFTYDGTEVNGQLRIWNWSKGILNLEKSQEWITLDITQTESISINDVDGDGKKEIVTSGATVGYGSFAAENAEDSSRAELKVWKWDGDTLILKQSKDWIVGAASSARNVGTGDLDGDGVVEIVTVGCIQPLNSTNCDPNLRIWSFLPVPWQSSQYLVMAIGGITVAAIIGGTIFLLSRRKSSKLRARADL
jgi:hypothetical protein